MDIFIIITQKRQSCLSKKRVPHRNPQETGQLHPTTTSKPPPATIAHRQKPAQKPANSAPLPPPFFSAACSPLQTLKNRAASAPLAPPIFPPARFPLQRACSRSFPNSGSSQFIFGPVASCCRNSWKTGPGVHRVRPLLPFPAASWRLRITKIRAGSAPLDPSL